MNLRGYYIMSGIKLFLGLCISFFTYTSINVYEDPAIAIICLFLGVFLFARGISFFLFLGGYKLFSHKTIEQQTKDSYRLSLLFGIYCLINILLLVGGHWNKILGLIILIGFIALQIYLIEGSNGKN